jgi:hypothetical protein
MVRSEVLNVHIKDKSPRSEWIFKLIFEDILGIELNIIDDLTSLPEGVKVLLNYSPQQVSGMLNVAPAGLLSEAGIKTQQITMSSYEDLPVFYQTDGGDLPFDPFSMSFFLVSRYEEYLPFKADQHARFPYTESLAFKEGFMHLAIVDRLADILKKRLLRLDPDIHFPERKYHFLPTVDIDIAYAHLGKGFIRTYGAMIKLALGGKFAEIRSRLATMRGKANDPFDNFGFMSRVFKQHDFKPVYFILAGDPGPFDRNLSLSNKKFAALIKDLGANADVGVHPSYGSGGNPAVLKKEINRISRVCGKKISKSRQHFVKMKFPDTYRSLIECGIKEDYSMGWADTCSFRAGTATPFRFYDLVQEQKTDLTVFPFMFMDSTLSDYMHLNPDQYLEAVKPLIEEVKSCKGCLCGIWHNYAIADDPEKKKAFEQIIKLCKKG